MIIPNFKIDQNEKNILIKIFIKYIKISEAELYIWENQFKFYLKPYFIKLVFNQFLKNEKYEIDYNFEQNFILITLEKWNQNEFFENLNIISNFKPIVKSNQKKEFKIEIVDDSLNNILIVDEKLNFDTYKIGFNFKFNNFFKDFIEERLEICDINSEDIMFKNRYIEKEKKEYIDFDFEHYLFDTKDEDKIIKSILKYTPKFNLNDGYIQFNKINDTFSLNEILSSEEKNELNSLKNQELLISNEFLKSINLILVDILYSYLYDKRVNNYEDNIESGWTINKISNLFSSNYYYKTLKENIANNVRRSIIYPIYRNFELSLQVIEDLKLLFQLKKLGILKALINIKVIFNKSKPRNFLNIWYINDLIHYIQFGIKDDDIKNILDTISQIKITKELMELELKEIEEENII